MDVRQVLPWQEGEVLDYVADFKGKFYELMNTEGKYILLQLNIKNFRYYCTKYGMRGGNEIIQLVLNKMNSLLQDGEYVIPYSADNFCAILSYEDGEEGVSQRMTEWADCLYRIQDDRIYRNLFVSMGIYEFTGQSIQFEEAYNYANIARKENEELSNRNHNVEIYSQKSLDQYMNRMKLEEKTAAAYMNYDFVTYLQPKVDLKTEKIIGAEALIRWFDKDGKIIPLDKFLPILNQNGYITLLDLDTFDHICAFMEGRVKDKKLVVPISFNVSKSHFNDPLILEDFANIFEKYQIPKSLIEIELMESISLDNTEKMKEIISKFREYGFACALDDFGSGYSSFGVLLNADIDIIKIDRQFFLENLNGDSKLIIKTIVDLIHSLKMKIVAEGVESKEHIDFLKECGCEAVQGYYYYKPMPIEEFAQLLDAQGQVTAPHVNTGI